MAQTVFHSAGTRGAASHGWLETFHTFSFAKYYNPQRMNFGALRVLNDDDIDGGRGFGEHPHDNMEIITIPFEGALKHEDSMGNEAVVKAGEIQVMSAGTGIYHKEFNANPDQRVKLLQIWLFPNKRNVTPRYDQQSFDLDAHTNELVQILSPNENDAGVWIHQDAWFNLGKFEQEKEFSYQLKGKGNGVYVFVTKGTATAAGQDLLERDAVGVWDTESLSIKTAPGTEILLMEVPMSI